LIKNRGDMLNTFEICNSNDVIIFENKISELIINMANVLTKIKLNREKILNEKYVEEVYGCIDCLREIFDSCEYVFRLGKILFIG